MSRTALIVGDTLRTQRRLTGVVGDAPLVIPRRERRRRRPAPQQRSPARTASSPTPKITWKPWQPSAAICPTGSKLAECCSRTSHVRRVGLHVDSYGRQSESELLPRRVQLRVVVRVLGGRLRPPGSGQPRADPGISASSGCSRIRSAIAWRIAFMCEFRTITVTSVPVRPASRLRMDAVISSLLTLEGSLGLQPVACALDLGSQLRSEEARG